MWMGMWWYYYVWNGLRKSGKVYGMEWGEYERVCVVYKVYGL